MSDPFRGCVSDHPKVVQIPREFVLGILSNWTFLRCPKHSFSYSVVCIRILRHEVSLCPQPTSTVYPHDVPLDFASTLGADMCRASHNLKLLFRYFRQLGKKDCSYFSFALKSNKLHHRGKGSPTGCCIARRPMCACIPGTNSSHILTIESNRVCKRLSKHGIHRLSEESLSWSPDYSWSFPRTSYTSHAVSPTFPHS
ncbi:hypothetical protein NEOLEDRAFT_879020 [Neolentinus lepideus HHB14362 ss-1]|uniref:Uncharacterized protein n=1 Tax=Neolentinus lepideus HHB14362 ss-1 TaxID=1314782 RepID=A0A165NZM0_9AGAM|nr:hypothetical protein NEOLEDRAFT_879020 [Neolentinus lepideus HHB14362 ss-1]